MKKFRTLDALINARGKNNMVEIIGPDNEVHYRRPIGRPDLIEAERLIRVGTIAYRINYDV